MARFTRDQFNEIMRRPGYTPLDAGVRHAEPKQTARPEPLDTHEVQKGSTGRAIVCIIRHGPGILDEENLRGTKYVTDAMRYAGLILGDDPKSIFLYVTQRKVKKADQGTEVLIIRP